MADMQRESDSDSLEVRKDTLCEACPTCRCELAIVKLVLFVEGCWTFSIAGE